MRYTWQQVADVLMMSRTTLWRRLKEVGMPLSLYNDITESELDGVVELLAYVWYSYDVGPTKEYGYSSDPSKGA